MPTKTKLLTVAVALLVVLSGCAGLGGAGGDGGDASSSLDGGDGGGGDAAPARQQDGGQQAQTDGSTEALQLDRAIIRTGTVELRVDDFDGVRSDLRQRVQSMGGFVGGSGQTQHTVDNTTWSSGYVVLRVPAERFSELLSFARERGTVLSEETSTEDVTDRLVDIEARMTNLQERRTRLRAFYDRANSTQELLRIEERLSNVQGDIEQLKAEKRSLERRVSYATLRVELRERHDSPEPTDDSEQSVADVFFGSVATIVDIGQWSALVLAGAVPYLLVFGIPAAVLVGYVRRDGGVSLDGDDDVTDTATGEESGGGEPDE